MPISNRVPTKELGGRLAITENALRGAHHGIAGATAAYNFTADDLEKLNSARDVLLTARARSEFPILARILDSVVKQVEAGEQPQWTPEQTKGFLSLVGDLSFTENDVLNKLRDLGVIPAEQWDAFVAPHKDATNDDQMTLARKAKWAGASMGTMLPTMGLGFGVALAVGGPAGALVALAASTTFGMTAGKRMQDAVSRAAFLENAGLGVNAAEGQEVSSEPMLIAARAAMGEVMEGPGTFADRLKQETALGEQLINARAASGDEIQALEQPFVEIAAEYLEGLKPISDQLDNGALTEIDARKAVVDVRAKALDSAKLDEVARAALAQYVNHPDGQRLMFLRQLAETTEQLVDQLGANSGVVEQEMRETAAAILQIHAKSPELVGTLSQDAIVLLATITHGVQLNEAQIDTFGREIAGPARRAVDELEPQLAASEDVAIGQAKLAFEVLWGTVVPAFNEIKDAPTAKSIKVHPLEDGFEVTGRFKGGMLRSLGIGGEGSFRVKVDDTGRVDPDSMKIDLGRRFAKHAGVSALETWARQVGLDVNPRAADVTDAPNARGNYEVTARMGYMTGKVEVTSLGLVAWDSLKVA